MKIQQLYDLFLQSGMVDTDTRKIRERVLFFALKGDNFNGNKFAEEALEKGASYSIIDEVEFKTNDKIIVVDDVLVTLQKLANFHRKQLAIPIISLTGSNGKTTTKELINAVLSKKYTTVATNGNLNNHIGVPLTLLSMNATTEIGIVEMGANHLKEIELLSSIAEPDYGYITNFGKAHLEGFGSVEGVIKGKSELYDFLKNHNKKVFVNPEDSIQLEKTANMDRILFDSTIEFLEVNPNVKLSFNNVEIQSNLIGKYNYNNIAVAITIGSYFGVSMNDIKEAIETYLPDNNRSQIIKKTDNTIVLDAYNANPTSMTAAIENFKLVKANYKTVILGDMFELGADSVVEHNNIAELVSKSGFDTVFLVGKNFYKTETSGALKFESFESLQKYLKQYQLKNQMILIKGSRGMALERCLESIN